MRERPESVGRAWTGTELRIVNNQDDDISCKGVGEIVGRSISTMCGYLNREDANSAIVWQDELKRTYLRTVDIGELDENRYLTSHGRAKDMILSGGLHILPIDIENVLLQHEAVVDAPVFGIDHEKWV